MTDILIKTLAIIGAFVAGMVIICLATELINKLKEVIRYHGYLRNYRNRFKKEPTAECYCAICEHWHPRSKDGDFGDCWEQGWITEDNFFCKNASKSRHPTKL